MPAVTFFMDDSSRAAREAEVPAANFDAGMNLGGSNACGIGINMDGGEVVGTPEQFTLLDQFGDIRVGQRSQHIGGSGYTPPSAYPSSGGQEGTLPAASIYTANNNPSGDGGVVVVLGVAALETLGVGWIPVVP